VSARAPPIGSRATSAVITAVVASNIRRRMLDLPVAWRHQETSVLLGFCGEMTQDI
jgi:hypothetical protein